jgi:hypothetical protein
VRREGNALRKKKPSSYSPGFGHPDRGKCLPSKANASSVRVSLRVSLALAGYAVANHRAKHACTIPGPTRAAAEELVRPCGL